MKNFFINHGFMGSNIENWFPWLKDQIDNDNNICIIPQYPIDRSHHFYDDWEKVLNIYKDFGMIDENSVIIGHSTGSIFSVKYILKNKIKIDKLILISGFNNYFSNEENDFHDVIHSTYFIKNEELKDVKEYAKEIVCIYGDNDPYISREALHDFSEKLGAKEVIINNGGHLNKEAGFVSFNKILEYIERDGEIYEK